MRIRIFGLVACLLCFAAMAQSQESCVAAQCHASVMQHKVVHAAAEDCTSCHESGLQPHPQKGIKTFKLIEDMQALCSTCHDSFGTKKSVHEPVKQGECTTCHDPHASDQPKLLTQASGELCITCHSDMAEQKHLHGPVSAGDCLTCHVPHESDTAKLLVAENDELCFSCHSDIKENLAKKNVHAAVDAGCTACHSPHGAAFPKLLASEGAQLCYQCHSEIGESIEKAVSVHGPVKTARSCASCHSPHASDHAKLLAAETKALCLECHKAVLTANMKVVHEPVKSGDCAACHSPHSSGFQHLLVRSFPFKEYVSYSDKEYELCFTCHDRQLLQYPDTSFATEFRDGERNLHFLHVNKSDKGRSCVFCHGVHGAPNSKMIVDSVPFGKWNLALKFVKTETGGSCAPGCHKPYSYNRNASAVAGR